MSASQPLLFAVAGEACLDLRIHGSRGEAPVHSGRSGDNARGGDPSCDQRTIRSSSESNTNFTAPVFHMAPAAPHLKLVLLCMYQKTKVSFSGGVEDRLIAYAKSVAHFPTALKEFEVSHSTRRGRRGERDDRHRPVISLCMSSHVLCSASH